MKPANHKERNDKFWVFLLLYVSSLVLTGFVVFTNVTEPSTIRDATNQNYQQQISMKDAELQNLHEEVKALYPKVKELDSLSLRVMEGNLAAEGQLKFKTQNFNNEINNLRQLSTSPLQQDLLKTYEKLAELININSVALEKMSQARKELQVTRSDLASTKNALQTCQNNASFMNN